MQDIHRVCGEKMAFCYTALNGQCKRKHIELGNKISTKLAFEAANMNTFKWPLKLSIKLTSYQLL